MNNITITIKSEDKEVSLTLPTDCNLTQLGEELKGLLVNWGYHPNNVDDLFNLDRWNYDKKDEE